MNKNTLIVLGLISMVLLFALALAESIRYDFDEVEVVYAAEFTARSTNVASDNWLAQIAGGTNRPVTVLYGIVNLKKGGQMQMSEEFIKVSGEAGSERFLLNSAGYDYYEGTYNYKDIKSFFWSAKKLVDKSVVKDFTLPIKSITFYRKFGESQNINEMVLSASNEGEKANGDFWSFIPAENLYTADLTTLTQSGSPTARSS